MVINDSVNRMQCNMNNITIRAVGVYLEGVCGHVWWNLGQKFLVTALPSQWQSTLYYVYARGED